MNETAARIAVAAATYWVDRPFSYRVPASLRERVVPGVRVVVPFGSGNRRTEGIVLSVGFPDREDVVLKPVSSVLDSEPVLSDEMLRLALWIRERYFCTVYDAVRAMLPAGLWYRMETVYVLCDGADREKAYGAAGDDERERTVVEALFAHGGTCPEEDIRRVFGRSDPSRALRSLVRKGIIRPDSTQKRRVGDKTVRMISLRVSPEEAAELALRKEKRAPLQSAALRLLCTLGRVSFSELSYFTGASSATVNALIKAGTVESSMEEVFRRGRAEWTETRPLPELNDEQRSAFEGIIALYDGANASASLLHGAVYIRLIDAMLARGKSTILLVPEISLTPQMIRIFSSYFGDDIAVLHSSLAVGERYDEWKRVRSGRARVVIGTRSAVFAPCGDLGLIIIDEEQEYTYKSENSPRFHARDAARFRCGYNKALLVLASATPSIETYYNATEGGRYDYEVLTQRYGNAILPDVEKIDISQMDIKDGIISPRLYQALRDNLESGRQSILLNNRRGFNTFVSCRACNEVITCPNCSVSMTYHSDNKRLMCHYCGYSVPVPHVCPSCGEPYLRFAGQGTQKAEEELAKLFPEARILRMDADSMTRRSSYDKKLGDFAAGLYDIMIGTQMVAKGLDFGRVTLVGVLMADQALYSDDFRSYERAFSLLTQVVGRSGRGESRGRAIIQTITPENPVIDLAASQDYKRFYENEIILRKAMLYPPFADICMVGFVGTRDEEVSLAADDFLTRLKFYTRREFIDVPIRALGPSPASIRKISGRYRYKIILKCRNNARFREMMHILLCESGSDPANKEVTVYADLNPDNVL